MQERANLRSPSARRQWLSFHHSIIPSFHYSTNPPFPSNHTAFLILIFSHKFSRILTFSRLFSPKKMNPPQGHSTIPAFHYSSIPPFQHSTIPPFHHSSIPPFHHST